MATFEEIIAGVHETADGVMGEVLAPLLAQVENMKEQQNRLISLIGEESGLVRAFEAAIDDMEKVADAVQKVVEEGREWTWVAQ